MGLVKKRWRNPGFPFLQRDEQKLFQMWLEHYNLFPLLFPSWGLTLQGMMEVSLG